MFAEKVHSFCLYPHSVRVCCSQHAFCSRCYFQRDAFDAKRSKLEGKRVSRVLGEKPANTGNGCNRLPMWKTERKKILSVMSVDYEHDSHRNIFPKLQLGDMLINPGKSVKICEDMYRFAQKLFLPKLQLGDVFTFCSTF